MTKDEIFQYFYTNSANLGVKSILTIMLAGLLIAALIYLTYWINYQGVAYNAKFNASLVVILLVSVVVMLMISSNIVISLGMVGALSIVRYRTAVKDSRDTVFIFWAIAEGLSVGSQNFKLAMVTTLFIAIIITLFTFMPGGKNRYLLVITGDGMDQDELTEAMKSVVSHIKLRAANQAEGRQELIYEVRSSRQLDLESMNKLSACKGVLTANWVSESGESVG